MSNKNDLFDLHHVQGLEQKILSTDTPYQINWSNLDELYKLFSTVGNCMLTNASMKFIETLSNNMIEITSLEELKKVFRIITDMLIFRKMSTLEKNWPYIIRIINSLVEQQAKMKGLSKQLAFNEYFANQPLFLFFEEKGLSV